MLPQLDSPKEFHNWFKEKLDQGLAAGDILALLPDDGDLAVCRRMCIAHWLSLGEVCEELVSLCLQSPNYAVRAYAIGLDVYVQIAHATPSTYASNPVSYSLLPFLQQTLRQLEQTDLSPFGQEAGALVRTAIAAALFFQDDYERAAEEASAALFWSERSGAAFNVARARSLLISIRTNTGRVHDALIILKHEESNPARPPVHQRFQQRAQAILLSQLGQIEEPLRMMEQLAPLYDTPASQAVGADLQRLELLLGIGGLEGEVKASRRHGDREQWITESMRCLVRALGLPRTNRHLTSYLRLLVQAVDTWRGDPHYKEDWGKVLARWIVGFAYVKQGRVGLAITTIDKININHTQWLDLRVLLAGLRIELALHLNCPTLAIRTAEDELRKVFDDAHNLDLASAEGLAQRLIYWHPVAAAYGALMPGGIIELQPATAAVLTAGTSNSVHGIQLAPVYAAELMLRSLDFDLLPKVGFVQCDPGSSRRQREHLLIKRGSVDHWLPSVSAASIIYGLKKAGYHDRAQEVYHSYGVAPETTAQYAMLPLVQHIKLAVLELLANTMTAPAFSATLLRPE